MDPDAGVKCRGGQSHPAGLHDDGLLSSHVLCGWHHCGQTLHKQVRCSQSDHARQDDVKALNHMIHLFMS